MLDLVLIAYESIPIFFVSKNKELTDTNTAAFISAIRAFAQGSLKTDLVSVRLGSLDVRLKEFNELLYVFGTQTNTENPPTESQLEELIAQLEATWSESMRERLNLIDSSKIPVSRFEECLARFEKEIAAQNIQLEPAKGVKEDHVIKKWDLIPKKTQKAIMHSIEQVILGEKIGVLDNDPIAPVVRDTLALFRVPVEFRDRNALGNYVDDIPLVESSTDDVPILDPKTGDISGKVQRNKYLEKFIEKEVIGRLALFSKLRSIDVLIGTVGRGMWIVLSYESKFTQEKGQVLNLLNSLGFEETRLILEIIKRNKPHYHEKLLDLPIHQEWFAKW